MDTPGKTYLSILEIFPSIDLENMDKVKLMDRKDTKFIFHEEKLPSILMPLKDDYQVLWVKGCYCCPYESVYYDTEDFRLFFDHHRGKLNRFKVRHRMYIGSGTKFFEIKYKTNKDRTIKERIKVPAFLEGMGTKEIAFLENKTDLCNDEIHPSLRISFSRITLVNLTSPERVTLDSNLKFEYDGKSCELPSIVIAETKQERTAKSPFVTQMKNLKIRTGSLSKYCMGISLLIPEIKNNDFKPKIKQLKKLIHDHPAGGK